ncbi:LysR family transcriptional regulator [Roseibium sp. M-1]
MIEVTPLRYFVSSFELGTISAAAAAHGISQPSLSQALQKLEDGLGTGLFVRTRKGLRPTPEGRDLYRHAQTILNAVQETERRFRQETPVRLSLYTAPDILLPPFQGAFRALRSAHPSLDLRFEAEAGDAELVLTDRTCAPKGHRFHELYNEPYVLAVPNFHPLAGKRLLLLDDLKSLPLIARRYCPFYDAMLAELTLAGLPLNVTAEAVHDHQVLELVAMGFAAALLPASHLSLKEGLTGIPVQHERLGGRNVGMAVKKTAFADEMFRIWLTGWAASTLHL